MRKARFERMARKETSPPQHQILQAVEVQDHFHLRIDCDLLECLDIVVHMRSVMLLLLVVLVLLPGTSTWYLVPVLVPVVI